MLKLARLLRYNEDPVRLRFVVMLEVIEQSPRRLVMRDQRPTAGMIAVIFVILSVGAVALLIIQFLSIFAERLGQFDGFLWMVGTVMFIALGIGFVILGMVAALHFLIGTTCVLDKDAEEFVIERVAFFRTQAERHSIYGISRINVQENEEVHAFGVFVVLKSGQHVPIASFHNQDEDAMRAIVRELLQFLQTG